MVKRPEPSVTVVDEQVVEVDRGALVIDGGRARDEDVAVAAEGQRHAAGEGRTVLGGLVLPLAVQPLHGERLALLSARRDQVEGAPGPAGVAPGDSGAGRDRPR